MGSETNVEGFHDGFMQRLNGFYSGSCAVLSFFQVGGFKGGKTFPD